MAIGIDPSLNTTIHCHAFQDNHATWQLATKEHITYHTKYFLVKWAWVWSHVHHSSEDDNDPKRFLDIELCSTYVMPADIFIKGFLGKFEGCHKLNQG